MSLLVLVINCESRKTYNHLGMIVCEFPQTHVLRH